MAQSLRSRGATTGRRAGLSRTGVSRPTPSRGSTPRAGAPRARTLPGRRKAAPKSASEKLVGALTGALAGAGGKAASKAKPSSKKGPAGLALLGAGAVAALKNKDRLMSLVKGKSSSQSADYPTAPAAGAPHDPVSTIPTDAAPTGMRPIE